jgi:SAM-dependent methyltransferase
VTGVDFAHDFIREARERAEGRGLKLSFEERDMRELPWANRFDGAFCFGNSFGYMSEEGNSRFLRAVASALKTGAKFILDTHDITESVLPRFREREWFQINDITLLLENRYDHVTSRLHTDYTFLREGRADKRPSSQRLYTYRELCGLLEEAGFEQHEGYGLLDEEPFKLNSERLLMATTKQKA